jgi:hypothetical protein
MLDDVRGRIMAGVGAWLLGAGAATGGSLLAVSLIGKGMTEFPGQPMAALATVTAGTYESSAAPKSPSPSPVPRRTHPSHHTSPTPQPPPTPDGTVLTSAGGEVVASCPQTGAYLMSWSPQQGYAVGTVERGPAAMARVSFALGNSVVTMEITCQGGTPSAFTRTRPRDE